MKKVVASLVAAAFLLLTPMTALADYTASVTQKDAPTYDEKTVEVSDPAIQEKLENGGLKVEITPVKDADKQGTNQEISDILNTAFDQIKTESVTQIFGKDSIKDGLKDVLTTMGKDLTDEEIEDLVNKMVVTNLFDISLVDTQTKEVEELGVDKTFTIDLDLGLTQDDVFLIYHDEGTGEWVLVPYEWLENGMIRLKLNGLSPIAVLMPAEQNDTIIPSKPENPDNPVTPVNPGTTGGSTTGGSTTGGTTIAAGGSTGSINTIANTTSTGSTGSTTSSKGGSNVSTGVSSTSGTLFAIGAVVAAAGIFFVVKAKKRID